MSELNKYSKVLTQDETQPAAQAMLYGIGLSDEDLMKAQVGVVSMGYDGNTCNMHLNDLAKIVKQGVWDNDLVGLIFNTIGVSDGMSNGTDGMRYSLVSRDIIADSIEAVCGAQYYDAIIALPGCDKNMPGSVIAMGRLNRPSIMVYGGTIAPGHHNGQDFNVFFAYNWFGSVTPDVLTFFIALISKLLDLRIFGDIYQHRARPSATGYIKCFCKNRGNLIRISYLVIPLGNRRCDIDDVCFLEGICSQQMSEHLSGNANNRSGINHCICKTSYKICCSRTTGGKYNPCFTGSSCKTLCSMNCTLFMTNQNMFKPVCIIIQCIVDRHYGATRITKDDFDAFSKKCFQYCLATTESGHRFCFLFGRLLC